VPGRDSRSRRPRVFHTQATAVLGSLAAYSQFNVEPDTLPTSSNWEAHAAERLKHREDCQKAINALNTVLIQYPTKNFMAYRPAPISMEMGISWKG
jgi:hypothetical protein